MAARVPAGPAPTTTTFPLHAQIEVIQKDVNRLLLGKHKEICFKEYDTPLQILTAGKQEHLVMPMSLRTVSQLRSDDHRL